MATNRNSRQSCTGGTSVLGKPQGIIQPRVQAVGPERFGIVAVDCAKARSKWMLCDFDGRVLIPPTIVEHGRSQLQLATVQLREACERSGLADHLVAIEMTGAYHRPVQRAFRQAGHRPKGGRRDPPRASLRRAPLSPTGQPRHQDRRHGRGKPSTAPRSTASVSGRRRWTRHTSGCKS